MYYMLTIITVAKRYAGTEHIIIFTDPWLLILDLLS